MTRFAISEVQTNTMIGCRQVGILERLEALTAIT
jgi:hypothetical protein